MSSDSSDDDLPDLSHRIIGRLRAGPVAARSEAVAAAAADDSDETGEGAGARGSGEAGSRALAKAAAARKKSFFGCYLLTPRGSAATRASKVYIGFTTDPNRRLRQHNGEIQGGAQQTKRYRDRFGEWEMRLCVFGFPTKIAALRFEWAWQNPHKSKRLKHVESGVSANQKLGAKLTVLSEMLHTPSWKRFPLTTQWIDRGVYDMFQAEGRREPPTHMATSFGLINKNMLYCVDPACKCEATQWGTHDCDDLLQGVGELAPARDRSQPAGGATSSTARHRAAGGRGDQACSLCRKHVEARDRMACRKPPCPSLPPLSRPINVSVVEECSFSAHMVCLAEHMLRHCGEEDRCIPVEAPCPHCQRPLLWGNLVRWMEAGT